MADNLNVPMIESEEALNELLDGQGPEVEMNEDGTPKDTPKDDKPKKDADDLLNVGSKKGEAPKGTDQPVDDAGEDEEEDKDDKDKDKEYSNVIAFLDSKHQLGLNLTELDGLTREDEAELVSDLFQKVVDSTNEKLRQYEDVRKLMEDQEVLLLLKAKSEGKGLKDLYGQYTQTSDGMTAEQLVFDDFKKKYPKMADASINNMIAAQKKEGQFDEIATAIREQRKEDETKSAQQRLQEEQLRNQQAEEQRQQEDQMFTGFVGKVGKVNGVAFTEEMKAEALAFALERDKDGLSRLDKALQSDVGVLRAILGITQLEKLMGAQTSVQVNKKNKKLFDRLFERPSQAGGGSGGGNSQSNEVPDEVFNRF